MIDHIGDLLPKQSLDRFGIGDEARGAFVCYVFDGLVRELCGARFSERVHAELIRREELVVRVVSSAWASEVKLREELLLRVFHERNPAYRIARIRYVVGAPEPAEPEPQEEPLEESSLQ